MAGADGRQLQLEKGPEPHQQRMENDCHGREIGITSIVRKRTKDVTLTNTHRVMLTPIEMLYSATDS
jgi:hypothetical protein